VKALICRGLIIGVDIKLSQKAELMIWGMAILMPSNMV
jgi:hypothetical protein